MLKNKYGQVTKITITKFLGILRYNISTYRYHVSFQYGVAPKQLYAYATRTYQLDPTLISNRFSTQRRLNIDLDLSPYSARHILLKRGDI